MIVVLDTNVLVSGLMSPGNPPGRIIDFLRAGDITLAIDDRILAEYCAVLARENFRNYFPQITLIFAEVICDNLNRH